ncbi:MAG: gamma-glutamyltransferase family protein, partial [Longimicrobiales bacterium]
FDAVPQEGGLSVSVPGAVAGWVDAHERFGTKPFSALLQPAIHFARDGFAVSTRLAMDFEDQGGSLNEFGRALYLPNGSAPPVGTLLKNPELAASLETIATRGKAGYYTGDIGRKLAAFVESEGGHLRAADFEAHTSTWVEPLRGDYLDHTMIVMPPNTQGPAQLAYMQMAKEHDLPSMGHNSDAYLHTRLLDTEYLQNRATLVDADHAAEDVAPGFGDDHAGLEEDMDDAGDTVYLTAVDQWGNAVSWIQSNFAGFGSGLLEPETGILLHNRGALYTLADGHPNQVAPGKRPYHTLSPMMAIDTDGGFAFTLGTPGGDSQPQSLIQIVNNLLIFDMTPQQAIEAPRFRSMSGLQVSLEDRVTEEAAKGLMARGHALRLIQGWTATFGGAQMIVFDPTTGVLTAAADPRREAYALAY